MKENIEEDIKEIEWFFNNDYFVNDDWAMIHRNVMFGLEESVDNVLSDYKRVLKENEELLQEKINNQKMIVLAQNDMLNYQAGFEDGKNGRTSAVQSIIENQQYYIFQKQIEKYERHIEKLQKENKELKDKYAEFVKMSSEVIANSVPTQKVKDKIEKLEQQENIRTLDFCKTTQDIRNIIIQELQELIEGRK